MAAGTMAPLTTDTPATARKAAGTLYDGSGTTVGSTGCVAAARAFLLNAPNCQSQQTLRLEAPTEWESYQVWQELGCILMLHTVA